MRLSFRNRWRAEGHNLCDTLYQQFNPPCLGHISLPVYRFSKYLFDFFSFCVELVSLHSTSVIYLHVLMFLFTSMHPCKLGRLMALSKENGHMITNTDGSFLVQDCLDIIGGVGDVVGTMCSLPALVIVSYNVHRSVSHSLYLPLSPTFPSCTSLRHLQLANFPA